jgi:hypothetical protein
MEGFAYVPIPIKLMMVPDRSQHALSIPHLTDPIPISLGAEKVLIRALFLHIKVVDFGITWKDLPTCRFQ